MRKDLLLVAVIVLIGVILFKGTKIQSVEEYYLTHIDDITPESETIKISIRVDAVLEHLDKLPESLRSEKYIPKDGIILEETEYVLRPGDTVFDVLLRATRHHKIPFDYQGSEENRFGSVYIKGINHLYEYDCGPLSGWMYTVNGEFPDEGVSKYKLEDGDVIAIQYTCDLGRDLGHPYDEKEVNP
ncbi:MAG: DUF4430 domain-containing protein [Bacilli bacterium]|nr:DUF4430 domain-containing protein [Bacilli bacterium]